MRFPDAKSGLICLGHCLEDPIRFSGVWNLIFTVLQFVLTVFILFFFGGKL